MSTLLRICTAGSVDDGKSTLIGRLLYDSRAVYDDQLESVANASRNRSAGPIDFSLFTDGLRAEREQGITIDVAYRYFATGRRTFILADTPGHEQYTRNMATGASTADLAILLVDARHGIRPQSRRHAEIARLLGISSFVLAVNKMDLVAFDRQVFEDICDEFAGRLDGAALHAIPISALHGDNITAVSDRTPWFDGPSLLEHLETVSVEAGAADSRLRLPVQLVLRPSDDFRGYAGQIVSGTVRLGDTVTVQPSRWSAVITRLIAGDQEVDEAFAPMSVVVVLDRDLDVSRGDVLTTGLVSIGASFTAHLVWLDERPLDPARPYLLKQGTRTVAADFSGGLALNEIGTMTVTAAKPLIVDRYAQNRRMGSFIVIDPGTNFTAGAGMILDVVDRAALDSHGHSGLAARLARIARAASTDAEATEAMRSALEQAFA